MSALLDAPFEAGSALSELLPLCDEATRILMANGQTTSHTIRAVVSLAGRFGYAASIVPRWGEATLRLADGSSTHLDLVPTPPPVGVDMCKVAAAAAVIEAVCDRGLPVSEALSRLKEVAHGPPVSAIRFVAMCAAGAAALGIIFGSTDPAVVATIALVAGCGVALRRYLGGLSANAYLQPLAAALLGGLAGAACTRLGLGKGAVLVSLCPCMVLLPGPHLLSGALDLAQLRLPLGAMRILHAALVSLMICVGLLLGLAVGGVDLQPFTPTESPVPLALDVLAAGVAVAAYGSFFAMPWRMLPIPVGVGMAAHAVHWMLLTLAGADLAVAAFGACLLVGAVLAPIADRLHLPFGGCAFAAVVSMIPGVYMFRMGGGLVVLVRAGVKAPPEVLPGVVSDAATALVVTLAIGLGLIIPALVLASRGAGTSDVTGVSTGRSSRLIDLGSGRSVSMSVSADDRSGLANSRRRQT